MALLLVIGQNSYKFNLLPSKQNMPAMQIDTLQLNNAVQKGLVFFNSTKQACFQILTNNLWYILTQAK